MKQLKMMLGHREGHPLNTHRQTLEELRADFDRGSQLVPRLRVKFLGAREGLQDVLLALGDHDA